MTRLSQETIKKALRSFGLTEKEAEIYIFLGKHGVLKGGEISKQTKTQKALVYRILKSLQTKGLVESTLESPARFIAVSFEKVIDLNIRAKQEESAHIAAQKKDLLNYWQNIRKPAPELPLERFTVIEGKQRIYQKLSQMIKETDGKFLTVMTVQNLTRAHQLGLFDIDLHTQSNIKFCFLTNISRPDLSRIKLILATLKGSKMDFEGRTPELGLDTPSQMAIRDQEEALFFITPKTGASPSKEDDVCLWTDCKSLVKAFTVVFEDFWHNSTDIRERITEIETDKLTPKTFIIGDALTAEKKYNEIIRSAKEEIVILTSSKGLIEFSKNTMQLNEWTGRGVSVKIMAPIVNENMEIAEQLSETFSVKHVPPKFLKTTVIDGKYLFQFKTIDLRKQQIDLSSSFDNTLYTSSPQYVKKMRDMLLELWKNSRPPSVDNLKSIIGTRIRNVALFPGAIRGPGSYGSFYPLPPGESKKGHIAVIEIVDEDPTGKLTEQDVLNEIMKAKKDQTGGKLRILYASQATAIIHPPDFFSLPPMLIRVHHIEKHSTQGEEEVIIVNLWLETPIGDAYVPVAILSDNPQIHPKWKAFYSASPAGQNVRLAEKDELQIRVHGNTLFAGWTVPIPLLPSQYVLPPACIRFEGYGEVKTAAYTIKGPSGRFTAKQNGIDAFVTFMHPESEYSGPGTDGFFVRDFISKSPNIDFEGTRQTLEHSLKEKSKS